MKHLMCLLLSFACLFSSRAFTQNPCQLATGLTGYFPFKGNAHDVFPSQTLINGIGYNLSPATGHDGAANSAYHFNGSSSWIDCGTDNRQVSDAVTVCAWVKTTEQFNGQWVAGKYSYNDDKGYVLAIGTGVNTFIGQVGFGGRDGTSGLGAGHSSGWSTTKVNDGQWHCLVGIAADSSWEIYVDGVLESIAPGSTKKGMATPLTVPFTIGYQSPASPVWMNGDIDDVRVYNRQLSPEEIECYCSNGLVPTENVLLPIDDIRIFPNPNPGAFTVELPQPAPPGMAFRIVDLTGRLVLETDAETDSARQTVQAGGLPNGLYFLQVVSGGKVLAVKKFVRQ